MRSMALSPEAELAIDMRIVEGTALPLPKSRRMWHLLRWVYCLGYNDRQSERRATGRLYAETGTRPTPKESHERTAAR
jgi:hypothetical protein